MTLILGNLKWVWIGITDSAKQGNALASTAKYVYDSNRQSINFNYTNNYNIMFPGGRGHGTPLPWRGNCISVTSFYRGYLGGKLADFPCSFYANSLCEF